MMISLTRKHINTKLFFDRKREKINGWLAIQEGTDYNKQKFRMRGFGHGYYGANRV